MEILIRFENLSYYENFIIAHYCNILYYYNDNKELHLLIFNYKSKKIYYHNKLTNDCKETNFKYY
jgi:hypothetical protein